MDLIQALRIAVEKGASDLLFVAGLPATSKIKGKLVREEGEPALLPDVTRQLTEQIYVCAKRRMDVLEAEGEDDFSFSVAGLSRFRVNVLRQRGTLAVVIRIVRFNLPDRRELGIPDNVMQFAEHTNGLVLVSGPAGSGKTTTLACLIDQINETKNRHIITIEDPIEYLHRHKKSVVTQRELFTDTKSYDTALRAALRQAPDVILLGEMRDQETIRAVITAAETGHLIFSTLHTVGAANTIDRIIDAFPAHQQRQVRMQLGMVLRGVISQQLVSAREGGMVPVYEVMVANNAIGNMIREAKGHQMEGVMYSSMEEGMITTDTSLFQLVRDGRITAAEALRYSPNPEQLRKRLELATLA